MAIEERFIANRPPFASRPLDKLLPGLAGELYGLLALTQTKFDSPVCRLDSPGLEELAIILIEFAEDIYTEAGLWLSVERYQNEFFGAPLPLYLEPGDSLEGRFDERRIRYFLHVLWSHLQPDYFVGPDHCDLAAIAGVVSGFLSARFRGISSDSSVTRFLRTPNLRAWDVKLKLVWAARHSYLFRHPCAIYHEEEDADFADVDTTDDFICQQCTDWSGLGVIDVLAGALKLSDANREDVRSWYERHSAAFCILKANERGGLVETLQVLNVVNDKPYTIRVEMEHCPFTAGKMVIGSLVPWGGEWYWSGAQKLLEKADEKVQAAMKKDFIEKGSTIAYRYLPDLAEKAREAVLAHHRIFIAHYGDDLVAFPDGKSLATAEKKRMRADFDRQPKEVVESTMKRFALRNPEPDFKFPDPILKHRGGIGVFYNPEQGVEYVMTFNSLLSAFRKKGSELTSEEEYAVREMVWNGSISPAFVLRLVREHGCGAIERALMFREFREKPHLEWLLRSCKGQYFRKHYPAIAFVDGDQTGMNWPDNTKAVLVPGIEASTVVSFRRTE